MQQKLALLNWQLKNIWFSVKHKFYFFSYSIYSNMLDEHFFFFFKLVGESINSKIGLLFFHLLFKKVLIPICRRHVLMIKHLPMLSQWFTKRSFGGNFRRTLSTLWWVTKIIKSYFGLPYFFSLDDAEIGWPYVP